MTMAIACITGASSGIGMEFAKRLSRMGYELILVSRNTKALKKLAGTLPCRCKIISCDLSDENNCIKLAEYLKTKNLTLFINNAGFGDWGSFDNTDLNKELDMINVNIKALHILTKEILKDFKKKDRGYILNVASSAGLLDGGPYMAAYYATKSYVTSLTSSIYEELKEAGSNVHISMLCPGPVDTNFNNVAGVTFALSGISASYCARYALSELFKGTLTIVPTFTMKAAVLAGKFAPRKLLIKITAKQQLKKG